MMDKMMKGEPITLPTPGAISAGAAAAGDPQARLAKLEQLKQDGLIDDARYAKQFARQRTESRKQGKFRVARDLRARGIPDRHIESALEEVAQHTNEAVTVRQRIERKLRSYGGEIDEKKMAAIYSSLLRAGFSADIVRRELRSLTREGLPENSSSTNS